MKEPETVMVIGLGEIGRPIFEVLKESERFKVYGVDLDEAKMRKLGQSISRLPEKVDVMHICLPCPSQREFLRTVLHYTERIKPKLLIIDSTVPPGTTFEVYEKCNCLVAHSPIYGEHRSPEYMKWEIRRWRKIIGGVNVESAKAARNHFKKAHVKTTILTGPLETELVKLLETIYIAWMVVFFQETHRVTRHFKANFEDIMRSIGEIHRVRLDRPIWYPGFIGGHCLIPNTELLLSAYDSKFLNLILKSNAKRKIEIENEDVRNEVEKIREKVEALQADLWKKHGYSPNVCPCEQNKEARA
jgi:UDP-N-acetyl-D-mannosaminuronate dehydrogenase